MKWIKNFSIGLVLISAVDSCIQDPTYSVVPHIELQELTFKKGSLSQLVYDTLIIKLKFTDGDGDLGVGAEDELSPDYQNPYYWGYDPLNLSTVVYGPDKNYLVSQGYTLLNYSARKLSQFNTLPDISSCQNWEQLKSDADPPVVIDTIYITQNLRHFNINVDFYTKNGSNYDLMDPATFASFPKCTPNLFRGTFPDLSNDRKNAPLDGTITFRIQSLGLYNKFVNKTLKIGITINDRAFHDSNVVEKTGFTLQQITK